MKRFLSVVGLFIIWLLGIIWANNWIDKREFIDFPGKIELSVAGFLWTYSPAISHEVDTERALKLSWLRVTTKVFSLFGKEKAEINQLLNILEKESKFVAKHIKSNHQFISSELNLAAFNQLLIYLNRVNLFQHYFDPILEKKLPEIEQRIGSESLVNQVIWYREMMIRARLRENDYLYKKYRENLFNAWNQHDGDIPNSFIEGIFNFYDGVLLCVMKRNHEAKPYLESAANNFSKFPRYTTNFLRMDLNVLLMGKGKMAGPVCDELITTIILTGE